MPTVFISHSNADNEIALRLIASLKSAGFGVWVDFENIRGGADWLCEIQAGIERCDAVVLLLTKAALASLWVERECLYAFQCGKPLLIALIDELRLPLHLVNIQYCDCRTDRERGAADLIRSLTELLSRQANRVRYAAGSVSARPSPANFFPYLEQLGQGSIAALVARELFQWAGDHADELAFGGRSRPAFHARVLLNGQPATVFSVIAYPRNPALQLPLQTLKARKPYHKRRSRRALLKQLNRALPPTLRQKPERADGKPSIPLHALESPEALDAIKRLLASLIADLRQNASA